MSTDPREFEHPIDGTTPNELPTVLGVGSLAPQAIEVAARAINEQHEFPAPLWIALVESKDRADQNRVKRDRAYAAAALSAAYQLMEAQAKAEALAPILALHTPEKRWTTPDYTGSFDTRQEAAELDESYDGPNVDYFEICAHCGSIERDWAEDHAEEWNYKLAMWPCKTAAAVLP